MYEVDRLRDRRFKGYRRFELPHDLDTVVQRAVDQYATGDAPTRKAILDALTPRAAGRLSVYGERAAALAVRSQSTDLLRSAVVATGMAHERIEDYRANMIVFAALNHSAELLGTTLSQLLDQVSTLIPPTAFTAFRKYAASDSRHQTLAAMGLRVVGEGPTFRYW